jgi:hypothetical protein
MSPHTTSQSAMDREARIAHLRALVQLELDAVEPAQNHEALAGAAREANTKPHTSARYKKQTLELYTGTWVHQEHKAVDTVLDVAMALDDGRFADVQAKLRRMTRTELEQALIAAARTIPLDAPASLLWPCAGDRG